MTSNGILGNAFLALILFASTVRAQGVDVRPNERKNPRDTLERAHYQQPIDVVSLSADVAPSGGGGDFFDHYARLGAETSSPEPYLAPRLTARLVMAPAFRIVIDASYHRSGFTELYEVWKGQPPEGMYVASVYEELATTAIPILGGIEYAPTRAQFTTYAGAAAGLAYTHVDWSTSTEYSANGYHRPVTNVNGGGIAPSFRLYAGVDLRFDRVAIRPSPFRGIFFEATWLFLPVSRDYFARIRAEGGAEGSGLEGDSGTLYLGGLTVTFGVNLQVLRPS